MGISEEEKLRRHRMVECSLGTHAMEGLEPDAETLAILRSYEAGDLTIEEFSSAMDAHAFSLVAKLQPLVGVA